MSKNDHLMNDALNEIGDDLIRDAEENVPALLPKRKNAWVKWVALAAAVLLMAVAIPFAAIRFGGKSNNGTSDHKGDTLVNNGEVGHKEEDHPIAEDPPGGEGMEYAHHSSYIRTEDGAPVSGDPGVDPIGEPLEGGITPKGEDTGDEDPNVEILPGQLTAGAWNDNEHFYKWLDLFKLEEQGATAGKFADAYYAGWGLAATERLEVTVKCDGIPVRDALVTFVGADGRTFIAKTNANGVAYLFAGRTGTVTVHSLDFAADLTVAATGEMSVNAEFDAATALDREKTAPTIQLMYVVDVTGSMGDEIRYIREELGDVIRKVAEANPGTRIELALLFYRDDGDEEKFRYEDFRDVTDPADYEAYYQVLKQQEAAGGGDFPEALDEAVEMAVAKGWKADATKLIFHVFDAPAHDESSKKMRLAAAVRRAAEKGVRINPVIASGADSLTEFTARSEAILTGGTFVFLTNDSGIGGDHHDPGLPDAVHEHLNALMIRLINGYHTGVFAEPVPWNAE